MPYLEPYVLSQLYPNINKKITLSDGTVIENSAGLLTDELIDAICSKQKPDHLRIVHDSVQNTYGAYQGLTEDMRYDYLKPCDAEIEYVAHMTKINVAQKILNGEQVLKNAQEVLRCVFDSQKEKYLYSA